MGYRLSILLKVLGTFHLLKIRSEHKWASFLLYLSLINSADTFFESEHK